MFYINLIFFILTFINSLFFKQEMDRSGQQGSGDDNSFTSRRKGRGPTHMRHLALRDESTQPMRITVEFDDDLKPIGKDGAQFTSYVAYLARSKISIDIPN